MADNEHIEGLDETILVKLSYLGENIDAVDARTLGHLRKIERAIRDEADARRAGESEVKRHNLSVSSIAKVSGVSHATFYNKPVLTRYVALRRQEEIGRTEGSISANLRDRITELETEIKQYQRQGAEMVQIQIENDGLRTRIRMLEVQLQGGQPAMDGRGEVLPFGEREHRG